MTLGNSLDSTLSIVESQHTKLNAPEMLQTFSSPTFSAAHFTFPVLFPFYRDGLVILDFSRAYATLNNQFKCFSFFEKVPKFTLPDSCHSPSWFLFHFLNTGTDAMLYLNYLLL